MSAKSKTHRMCLQRVRSLGEILVGLNKNAKGYISPFGAKLTIKT